MDTTDGHLLLVEKRHHSTLLEKSDRKLYSGFLAQAEQGPEDCTDMNQGPQPTPLCPGSVWETEAVPG